MLNLDINKEITGRHIVYGRVGDNNSHIEKVSVINSDGTPFSLTGISICFMGNTHQNQTKVIDSDGVKIVDAAKGLFQYTFPSMAFGVAGPYERAYFQFTNKDGVITSTGDFEVIVLDNTDITSNEAETVITEYNKLVAELNELQNQAIDEMNRNFTEAQGRISELEVQINDLRNKIDQALTDFENGNFWTKEESFNKEESSANVINIVTGKKEVELTFVLDLKDKIAGSDVENKHSYRYVSLTDGILPATPIVGTEVGNTGDWEDYGLLYDLDNKIFTTTTATAGKSAAHVARWNLLEEVKEFLGDKFFTAIGATDVASQVAFIRSKGTSLVGNTWGFGSSASGNKLSCGMYRQRDKDWPYNSPNTQNSVKKMSSNINPSSIPFYIADDGFVTEIAYAEPSDGVTQSATRVDYSNLEFKMKISMSEYFNSLIAAYHGENIATKEEALDGESNDKIMTPLRVANVISTLGSGGNAVASSEEALAGVENTKIMSALRVKEVLDARENEIATSNVFSAAFMRSGQISFMRRGPILIVNGTVTVKTAQAALTDLFVPDLGGKVPLNNAGNILAISDKAPYAKRFLISSNGGNFRTISALEADEYLAFSGSIMLAP